MKNLPQRQGRAARCVPANDKSRLLCASALVGAASVFAAPAFAQDTTMKLIEIMRDNGSITQAQYDQLKAAAAQDEQPRSQPQAQSQVQVGARNNDEAVNTADETRLEQRLEDKFDEKYADMDWASKIRLKGDIRLRYQYGDNNTRLNDAGNHVARHRGRVRYRLGVITQPLESVEVGAGLASGGDDPRSTNQTFTDDFSSKGIRLDYAYAQWKAADFLTVIGGKFDFSDYLWVPTDLLWDGDLRMEGASAHLNFDNAVGTTFANGGVWVLQEFSNNNSDPYIYYGQLGQDFTAGNVFGTLAGAYYGYENSAQPGTFNPDYSAGTNTDDQFGVVNVNGALGVKYDGGKASLIGEYVVNTETDTSEDQGFAIGAKVGVDRWAFKYIYADLDANATPDIFPDSDRLGGATDMKGHEVAGAYAVNDAVELGLDYYNTQRKSTREDEQILQADLSVSF